MFNNSTYITLTAINAELLGISNNNRKSIDGTLTIVEYSEGETIPQEVLDVVISSLTHQQAIELVETNEWKQINFI
jgi:hypothetical protein